jgi:hypothetical protein
MTNLRVIYGLVLAGAIGVVTQPMQAQNFLVNSNFATGDFTGWSVAESGVGGSPEDFGVTPGPDGGVKVPNTGDVYGAFFNPSGGTMDLSQTVNLPAAGTYIISCNVRPVINDADTVTIFLGGVSEFTTNFEVGAGYTPISVTVSAEAGSQVVDFQFTPGSGPIFFDDASLVSVGGGTPPPPPPTTPCSVLGTADAGAVIGLDGTQILNFRTDISGDVYVSRGGVLDNLRPGLIDGNVFEYGKYEYFGRGSLTGGVTIDATLLDTVNADAMSASSNIAAMTPTQEFGAIRRPTTITGNGGVNVISIDGNITRSLTLGGGSNDVFFVNVSGTIELDDHATLAVSGGVPAGAVIYNLTKGFGTVAIGDRVVVNGTILAPGYNLGLEGKFNGAVIGGGRHRVIELFNAQVNQPVCPQ